MKKLVNQKIFIYAVLLISLVSISSVWGMMDGEGGNPGDRKPPTEQSNQEKEDTSKDKQKPKASDNGIPKRGIKEMPPLVPWEESSHNSTTNSVGQSTEKNKEKDRVKPGDTSSDQEENRGKEKEKEREEAPVRNSADEGGLPIELWHGILSDDDLFDERLKNSEICHAFNLFLKLQWIRNYLSFGITPTQLKFVTDKVKSLNWKESISVIHLISTDEEPVTANVLNNLKKLPHLEEVYLTYWNDITDDNLKDITKICPEIVSLSLWRARSITTSGILYLQNLENLDTLSLGCCPIEDGLRAIVDSCPKLSSLNLDKCRNISRGGFGCLPNTLTTLILTNHGNVSVEDVRVLAERCPGLKELCLSACQITDISLASLPKTLGILNLRMCYLLTNFSLLKTLENLNVLDLCSTNIKENEIEEIVNKCDKLTSLNLSSCSGVTDSTIAVILKGCKNLRELDISKCRNITKEAVLSIVGFKGLTRLCLGNIGLGGDTFPSISSNELKVIVENNPKLTELDLSGFYTINDEDVKLIAEGCPNLAKLSLCSTAITDACLEYLPCNIIELDLTDCNQITAKGLVSLLRLRKLNKLTWGAGSTFVGKYLKEYLLGRKADYFPDEPGSNKDI